MTLLRVIKRSQSSINNNTDFNSSVFRYFVAGREVKRDIVKSGLKSAFLGMLDVFFLPNSSDFEELSNWTFSEAIEAVAGSSDTPQTLNTYDGIKYIYKEAVTTQIRAAIPAVLNGFTGRTFREQMTMTGVIYVETSDLLEITHGELLDPPNPSEITDIPNVWEGAEPAYKAVFNTVPAGYYAVQGDEVGTHGKDGFAFKPLSFWDELVSDTTTVQGEYTGIITEEKSGFKIDSKSIQLNLTQSGEMLFRYNPEDVLKYIELIKTHYNYRVNATFERDL